MWLQSQRKVLGDEIINYENKSEYVTINTSVKIKDSRVYLFLFLFSFSFSSLFILYILDLGLVWCHRMSHDHTLHKRDINSFKIIMLYNVFIIY